MRCVFWKLAALCGMVLSCSGQGSKTEIVVEVQSDLSVPADIDTVQVEVTGPADKIHSLSFPLTGTTQWPLRFSLVPSDNQDTWFDVKVTGLLKDVAVVVQESSSSCVPNQRKVLAIFLDRICQPPQCTTGLTCRFGGCTSIAVAPETLPDYDPSILPLRGDASIATSMDAPIVDAGNDGVSDGTDAEVALLDADTDAPRDAIFDGGETSGLDVLLGTGMDAGVDIGAGGEVSTGGVGGAGGTSNTGGVGGGGGSTTVVVNCPSLTKPTNGDLTVASTIPGATATYSCSAGYVLSGGPSSVKCQDNGTWSDSAARTCIADCGAPPSPSSGTVNVTSTTLDSIATYACPTGYTPVSTSISCQADRTWSGTAPTCTIVQCPALTDPIHGTVSVTTTTYQSKATYLCSTGYTLTGGAERTCQADGTWSVAPTCSPVDCGKLAAPTNGSVTTTPNTTYGSTATYACSGHYALSGGSSPVQCGSDGKWSGTAPTCEVNCGQPPTPSHGGTVIPAAGTWKGSTAQYYCYGDLQLSVSAASSTTCQADGTWSGTVPSCVCLGVSTSGWGDACQYTCSSGTSVEGIKGCSGTCWQAATKC